VDLKTGYAYGIKLDQDGNCKAVQPLNTAIETLDERLVRKFGPNVDGKAETLPYGKTTYAVEMTDGKPGEIFTIVWPKKAEADKGVLPVVAKRGLPEDLVKAGVAPKPKIDQGAAVDDEAALKAALK